MAQKRTTAAPDADTSREGAMGRRKVALMRQAQRQATTMRIPPMAGDIPRPAGDVIPYPSPPRAGAGFWARFPAVWIWARAWPWPRI
ncbi:MAG: hypothetical protein ACYCXG_07705 [Acidiferrobacter sp.]